ncbi:MAG: hypothetical protein R2813_06020 [Flavobacteriales bacterium]
MAKHQHEIDKVFRDRFEGFKDHSQNADLGWLRLESELNNATNVARQDSLSSGLKTTVWLKIAASVAGIALVTVAFLELSNSKTSSADSSVVAAETSTSSAYHEGSFVPNSQTESSRATASDLAIGHTTQKVLTASDSRPGEAIGNNSNYLTKISVNSRTANSHSTHSLVDLATSHASTEETTVEKDAFFSSQNSESSRNIVPLNLMDCFKSYEYQSALLEREFPKIEDPTIDAWNSSLAVYARVAARTGTGESNSYEIKASPKLNPLLSIGLGYALSDRSFITVELGWLRKSGNGIERARQINVSSFVNSISGSNSTDVNQLIVHEGLIATRLDYMHIPVAYHQLLSNLPVFSDKWNVSLGGYTDILLTADNEAYIIYNSEEYKLNPLTKAGNNVVGLNRVRFGFFTGLERQISERIVANATITFPPFNSAVDANSDYQEFDQANKPLDLQLGLKFHL